MPVEDTCILAGVGGGEGEEGTGVANVAWLEANVADYFVALECSDTRGVDCGFFYAEVRLPGLLGEFLNLHLIN